MARYGSREYTDVILALGACNGNVSTVTSLYAVRFPNLRKPDRRMVQRIEGSVRFRQTKTLPTICSLIK